MKREPPFKSEAEMCAAFIEWAKRFPEWTPYPETCDWDILMVHADGTQIGIQAKLKLNLAVIAQAIEQGGWYPRRIGPDFRAVLVPEGHSLAFLCNAIGITVIDGYCDRYATGKASVPKFTPSLNDRDDDREWHYVNPARRHELPRYVPADVPAGVPSPSPLTRWKIAALEIVAMLEIHGRVTREDFKIAGIDHRRWTQPGWSSAWLDPVPGVPGAWQWNESKRSELAFAAQHPIVYPQVLADIRKREAKRAASGVEVDLLS